MSKKSGGKSAIKQITDIVWAAVVVGFVIFILRVTNLTSGGNIYDTLKDRSDRAKNCYIGKGCAFDFKEMLRGNNNSTAKNNPTSNNNNSNSGGFFDRLRGNSTTETKNNNDTSSLNKNNIGINIDNPFNKAETINKLDSIKIGNWENKSYKRTEWKHWILQNGSSCWDTREEVLSNSAKPGTIKYLDKNKKPTSDKSKACSISSGEWLDPYSGKTFTNPKDLDIDHLVPLGYTNGHGGSSWDKKKKSDFANDFSHLIAVSAKENRSKGAKGPAEYMPPNKAYLCEYSNIWINTVDKYKLTISKADKSVLEKTLKESC